MAQIQVKCAAIAVVLLLRIGACCAQASEGASPQQTTPSTTSLTQGFEIFCDFRCPFCARLFSTLQAGAKYEHKQLDFVFYNFPLQTHAGSDVLARFFEGAVTVDEGSRVRMIEDLYSFRTQTTSENLNRFLPAFSVVHGLDPSAVVREMRSRNVALKLDQDLRLGALRKVDGTPTVFFEGRPVPPDTPEGIAAFILKHSEPSAVTGEAKP